MSDPLFFLTLLALMCSSLPELVNGAIAYITSEAAFPPYELGTVARYSCDTGFGFPSAPVSISVTCQSNAASLNGVWSGTQLTCSGKINFDS